MFINYPHRKREIPIRHFVPNMITTISLACGLASMHYTLNSDYDHALFAILLAAVFDALDGRFARLLKATSPFGAVLDSLADFLSFGVAPAMLLYQWMLKSEEALGLAAVMCFVVCSALRLARFTAAVKPARAAGATLTPDEQRDSIITSKFFKGMPTPAAGGTVLIPPMLEQSKLLKGWMTSNQVTSSDWWHWCVIGLTFGVALLMISRVPMFSFKKMRIARWVVVPMLALVALFVVLIVKDIWLAVTTLAAMYVASIPLSLTSHRRVLTRPPAAEPPKRPAAA